MTKDYPVVLVVGGQRRMRDALNVLLAAVPQIGTIINVDSDLAVLETVAGTFPTLTILDTNLSDEGILPTLKQIRSRWPQIRCLVLADTIQQQQRAQVAGADDVLLKGFSTTELLTTVERLLNG